jgi:hypothetical protein
MVVHCDNARLYAVPADHAGRRISPTVVSQFVRLDQCRRYLRLALHERACGSRFMRDYDVAPQEITPLLTRAGAEFEQRVEKAAREIAMMRNLASERRETGRDGDNDELIAAARRVWPDGPLILFQARLRVALDGWDMTGDADIVRLERDESGLLDVVVADMKATRTSKVEHRLQVAFYREMLRQLFADAGIEHRYIATAILYRGEQDDGESDDPAEATRVAEEREAAMRLFGVDGAQLELTPHPEAYRDAVRDLVTGTDSVANEVIAAPFAEIPWHLNYKCDGCLYNEFCMKWAAEHDDLSLLPFLTEHEKRGLARAGIATTRSLATLLEPTTDDTAGKPDLNHLRAAPGREGIASLIARTWPVGPRLEELAHRARRYRRWQGDTIESLPFIPSKGYGSLPYSDVEQNPNLVRIFIDAQHDYLNDRIYLLGSLVVCNEGGLSDMGRRRAVVEMTDGPPDAERERELLVRWIDETIRAVAELAAPDPEGNARAPIHLIFFNGFEQRLLLEALNRHAQEILGATPLYDFITQLAAFDSPVATFLDHEIRELKNYPMVCQSLQAVAATARPNGAWFDWNQPEQYREIFHERMFDALGKFDDTTAEDGRRQPWSTKRSRFNSQVPLEYAYAAWDVLPDPPERGKDSYAPYWRATVPLLLGFQRRRLEALEHIASDFSGNRFTTKSSFAIPELSQFEGKARNLAEALQEFVTIERHVELAAWKAARLAAPERRVLAGDTLIVRYLEGDQFPDVAATYAENLRRMVLKAAYRQTYLDAHPGATKATYTPDQRQATALLELTAPFRLRLETVDTDVSLEDALALTDIKPGDRVIIEPRWTVDSRLPAEEQTQLTPTPKQMLYGMRHELIEIEKGLDTDGRVTEAWLWTKQPNFSASSGDPPGFLFSSFDTELEDGRVYTVDPDPNDIYGFWGAKVINGLLAGNRNELFKRVSSGGDGTVTWPEAAAKGQERFMAGLQAMHLAGAGTAFEPSKVELIGEHGDAPLLLVQGPPGTGKSYTTAFAILSRFQGALAAGMPHRALIGAKTHAATDVLLANVAGALEALRQMRSEQSEIFAEYFDHRLLDIPLFRLQPRGEAPSGVTALLAGTRRQDSGQARPFDLIASEHHAIVAATPGAVYSADGDTKGRLFSNEVFDLLVLDEASQLSLPESIMAALPLKHDGQVIVVGDHRQMAPIVKHDWENETRRTFQDYAVYRSLFDTILACHPTVIQFERSFRLDQDMAEFLRRTIYAQDGLRFHSERRGRIHFDGHADEFIAAVLHPEHPLVIVVHDEASSQLRNDFERDLTAPLLTAMYAAGYEVTDGFGMVVPHRAQRANLQQALRNALPGGVAAEELLTAVDTVERFQGGERDAIVVSATESDPAYLLAAGKFLYDPRRLTVAISRARDKMVLVAARSVFELFSPDEETFVNAQIWKDLLLRTCTVPLWSGTKHGQAVEVWGNPPLLGG